MSENGTPVPPGGARWRAIGHRALDLLLLLLVLPLAVPVGAAIAVCVFLDSPGPVLFRSPRVGVGGRTFNMLKFRTMRREGGGLPLSASGDERYTPLGRALARTRLDELPQLWHVLRGQMRFVGPRPELGEFVEVYPHEYAEILRVPPGLTGETQIVFADEGALLAEAEDRVEHYRSSILPLKIQMDLEYAREPALRRDLRVLALTALLPISAAAARTRRAVAGSSGLSPAISVALVLAIVVLTGLFAVEAASSP